MQAVTPHHYSAAFVDCCVAAPYFCMVGYQLVSVTAWRLAV